MKKILIARPNYDNGTNYLFFWSEEIITEAKSSGYNVTDVRGDEVTQKNIIGRLNSVKPDFVFLNGHGSKDSYCGHNLEEVITLSSAEALANTVTFIRACNCLEELGEASIMKGGRAFIGYKKEFIIPFQYEYIARPLKDPMARPVLEASNQIPKSLINGSTASEAVDASHKFAKKQFLEILFSSKYSEDLYLNGALMALVNNDLFLDMKGDKEAKIS
ncbi:MAG: hypothetical protein AABX01_05620 [Candidatus Micrarchaeota archaeon]